MAAIVDELFPRYYADNNILFRPYTGYTLRRAFYYNTSEHTTPSVPSPAGLVGHFCQQSLLHATAAPSGRPHATIKCIDARQQGAALAAVRGRFLLLRLSTLLCENAEYTRWHRTMPPLSSSSLLSTLTLELPLIIFRRPGGDFGLIGKDTRLSLPPRLLGLRQSVDFRQSATRMISSRTEVPFPAA